MAEYLHARAIKATEHNVHHVHINCADGHAWSVQALDNSALELCLQFVKLRESKEQPSTSTAVLVPWHDSKTHLALVSATYTATNTTACNTGAAFG
eukprot:15560-Heterococcus_DN1.PRE.2